LTEQVNGRRASLLDKGTTVSLGVMLIVAGLVWHAGQILRDMNIIITNTNQSMLDRVEERYVSKEVFNLRMDALQKELEGFRKEFKDYVEGSRPPR
jgi:hypothetical protein